MNHELIRKLGEKLYFRVDDVARFANLNRDSARVLCSRYAKKGVFIRLKNNFYVLEHRWGTLSREELLRIGNHLQVPSYVSFMTALSYHEVTSQVTRDLFESACIRRTKDIHVKGVTFRFHKIRKDCYSHFERLGDIFIATKEKALVDSVYLQFLGRYALDVAALEIERFDLQALQAVSRSYPAGTQEMLRALCKI